MTNVKGFFAYPSASPLIGDAISEAVELCKDKGIAIERWEAMRTIGFKLDELVRSKIANSKIFVADITFPNHNVFYEIGFAIASAKPIILTVNTAVEQAVKKIQLIGLFDTIAWAAYNNAQELSNCIQEWPDFSWTNKFNRRRDHVQPLFILDTSKKTDFRNHIFHAADNSQINYRTFDPAQVPRLTAAQAISDISASAGVILPIISSELVDAERHNLRASFLLGLSHGYGIETLAIQYEHSPVPLDYRDFVTNSTFRKETENHVEQYCAETLIRNQQLSARDKIVAPNIISKIYLGSPVAENETQQLETYFIETAEYSRALRAEGAVVTGRKGSGKSAVFFQIARASSKNKSTCIVDLRPASHDLSEMREALLSVVNAGVFDHTIAAFWQFIIYVEILLKIREKILPRSRNDFQLQEKIRKIELEFSLNESVVSGDFTSRLDTAVREVIRISNEVADAGELRKKLTNILFENPIPKLRDAIVSLNDYFSDIIVLIDDLDKGWPPRQVETHDIATIKHLIEVLGRIQRDIIKRKIQFRHLVFLRSDIYEFLVEHTSDRGKYNLIRLDWSDKEQLQHLLMQRVISQLDPKDHNEAWAAINPKTKDSNAVNLMIESSLRRPRFLIDLCERTLSFAINRGHAAVTEDDVMEGMRQMSLYLVSDFGYEMRDVAGTPEDIFYLFLNKPDLLTEGELKEILSKSKLGIDFHKTVDLLLWYGFLGVVTKDNRPVFIYDRAYDFRRLEAERGEDKSETLFAINPAFLKGL